VSEPDLVHDSFWVEQDPGSDQAISVDVVPGWSTAEAGSTTANVGEQLQLRFDSLTSATTDDLALETQAMIDALKQQATAELDYQRQLWEQEHAALLSELMQARSLAQEQVERIRHLEQALDQSLVSLKEMRLQVVDQQFLEAQLASTEEISNIQQQAIIRLKLQLAEQQQTLDTQLAEAQARDRNLHELLATMETLTQTQQVDLEQLRSQITQDRAEVQTYQAALEKQLADFQAAFDTQQQRILDLEAQALSARTQAGELESRLEQAQHRVSELSQNLGDRQTTIQQLEQELQQARLMLQEQQSLLKGLQRSQPSAPAKPNPGSDQELAVAQMKVEELETEVARQITTQAMLQHAWQELEEARDFQRSRIMDLEKQTADMQEQILRQAQQASEYETAVQHWKDRYFTTQTQVSKLKDLLAHALPDPPAELAEVLAALEAATAATPEPASPALLTSTQLNRGTKVDLPEFLMRRRNYKARKS
jgi:predicted  nucleic acid-binding Zn-ribbon protein